MGGGGLAVDAVKPLTNSAIAASGTGGMAMHSPREERYPVQSQLRHGSGVTAASAVPFKAGIAGTSPTMAEVGWQHREGCSISSRCHTRPASPSLAAV